MNRIKLFLFIAFAVLGFAVAGQAQFQGTAPCAVWNNTSYVSSSALGLWRACATNDKFTIEKSTTDRTNPFASVITPFTLNASGIGIGNTNPGSPLHVSANAGASTALLRLDGASSAANAQLLRVDGSLTATANSQTLYGGVILPSFAKSTFTGLTTITWLVDAASSPYSGSGAVSNAYGLYVTAPTGGANNWAAQFNGTILQPSGQFRFADGTAGTPSLSGVNYPTTGMFFSPGPILNFSVAGFRQAYISGAGYIAPDSDNVQALGFAPNGRWSTGNFGTSLNLGILTNATGQNYSGFNGPNDTVIDIASAANVPRVAFQRERGTQSARANVQIGDGVGAVIARAYSGATGLWDTALMSFFVDGAVVDNQRPGGGIEWFTNVPNGAQTSNMKLSGDGGLTVGSPSGGSKGAGTINFATALYSNGGSNVVYRCATAGNLRAGALTITAADCGSTTDTGLRIP